MKTLIPRLAAATILVASLALTAPAAESLSVLLQKGIYAEETEGNLDSAIKIYEQIAAASASNRSVVAQAQYRLAVCYQKQGKKEQAIKVLNELVQQFPGDPDLSRKARAALLALGESPETALSVRRVSLPFSPGWIWDYSRDGRYISYGSRLPDLDILVCELATGKNWTVFHGVKDGETPWTNALISPDSQRIAFDVGTGGESTGIYVANLDGSERRKIYTCDPKTDYVHIMGWSPDGRQVFAYSAPTGSAVGKRILMAVDVKTGIKAEIANPANQHSVRENWDLSPNARLLVRQQGDFRRTIRVLNLATRHEETIGDIDIYRVVGWTPDSKRLVFSKNSTDGIDLWVINLDDGKPMGRAEKVWSNLGAGRQPFVGPDGNIYYTTRKNRTDPYELWVMEGVLATKPAGAQTESWRIQTDIPKEELILGVDSSILDRKFNFGARLPQGWTVSSAVRQGNGGTVIQFTSLEIRDARATPRIIYWPTTPWENPGSAANDFAAVGPRPTTPAEIDAWLHNRIKTLIERIAGNGGYDNFKATSDSKITVINGHRAVTIMASYTRGGKPWVQLITTVYSEKVIAGCDLKVPSEKLEQIQPAFERLVGTIRLP